MTTYTIESKRASAPMHDWEPASDTFLKIHRARAVAREWRKNRFLPKGTKFRIKRIVTTIVKATDFR